MSLGYVFKFLLQNMILSFERSYDTNRLFIWLSLLGKVTLKLLIFLVIWFGLLNSIRSMIWCKRSMLATVPIHLVYQNTRLRELYLQEFTRNNNRLKRF